MSLNVLKLVATSPSSATTAASAARISGLDKYESLLIYAALQGATGGTLDIYVQTLLHGTGDESTGVWVDYIHYPQISAGASATKQVFSVSRRGHSATLFTVGSGTSPALMAGAIIGGEWGSIWRYVFVAGAGTSAGTEQTLWVTGVPR